MAAARPSAPEQVEQPLGTFSNCHAGILKHLQQLGDLPELVTAAARARQIAADALNLFHDGVMEHHADEEKELFPSVLRSAQPGEEAQQVAAMIERLTAEHRTVEAMWKKVESGVRSASKGTAVELDVSTLQELVAAYMGHAQFEEQQFLPLAEKILGRNDNHMAALGLALHLRHAPPVVGYI